jgi:hypothetical protein
MSSLVPVPIVAKSKFEIYNKKYVSVVVLLESNRNFSTLDLTNWNDLMRESNFNLILKNVQARHKSSVQLNDDLCYSINVKTLQSH